MSEFPGFGPGQTKPPKNAEATRGWNRLMWQMFIHNRKAINRSRRYRRLALKRLRVRK